MFCTPPQRCTRTIGPGHRIGGWAGQAGGLHHPRPRCSRVPERNLGENQRRAWFCRQSGNIQRGLSPRFRRADRCHAAGGGRWRCGFAGAPPAAGLMDNETSPAGLSSMKPSTLLQAALADQFCRATAVRRRSQVADITRRALAGLGGTEGHVLQLALPASGYSAAPGGAGAKPAPGAGSLRTGLHMSAAPAAGMSVAALLASSGDFRLSTLGGGDPSWSAA